MSSNRRVKVLVVIILVAVIAVSAFATQQVFLIGSQESLPIPYVGIAFCGNTTAQAFEQIDRAKNYTNLFILDSGRNPISRNESAVYQICDYAVDNDLSVILNLGIYDVIEANESTWFWYRSMPEMEQNFTERWGDKFLGVYYNDEPGGIQLDGNWSEWYREFGAHLSQIHNPAFQDLYQLYLKMNAYLENGTKPADYDLETRFFVDRVVAEDPGLMALKAAGIQTFTSDYALYWFDYLGTYDVMFTELGWNASVSQQIALVKGAARLMDKEWGAIITWKYDDVPFLDSGEEIYQQMLTAYQAGAKYITIFNYAAINGQSAAAMQDTHYLELERFWNDIHTEKFSDLSQPEAVLVLPHNYGWGMRNPTDTIWGFWPPDDKSVQVGTVMSQLLAKYGASLDIVYEDSTYPISKVDYQHVYYWNSTAV
ncbi:MAG: hypothetical protein ACQCN6_12990 [Candidatus Bathyarchaeia archaeon]|jgi:hypothetical protein